VADAAEKKAHAAIRRDVGGINLGCVVHIACEP
jgi:hypothetical protein